MQNTVRVKVHEASGTIVLDRPEKRNALTRWSITQLREALHDLHQERRVRAVILTGAGTAFCAGMDLSEMRETAAEEDAWEQWYQDAVQYKDLLETMLRFPKPIIAAVNGAAVAGGAGLVLAADIVVGCSGASFGFPEPRRGLVAGLVAPLLTFRIGGGMAANMLLTGQLIDAERALQIGVYHQLVPHEQLWAQAHEIAGQCAECAPESLQLTKRLLNETIGEHLETMLSAGAAASATSRTTEAAIEGLSAFLEKRLPQWR